MMPQRVSQTVERVKPYKMIVLILFVSVAIVLIIAYGQQREKSIMAIRDERKAQMDSLSCQVDTLNAKVDTLRAKVDSSLEELRYK